MREIALPDELKDLYPEALASEQKIEIESKSEFPMPLESPKEKVLKPLSKKTSPKRKDIAVYKSENKARLQISSELGERITYLRILLQRKYKIKMFPSNLIDASLREYVKKHYPELFNEVFND